MSQLPRSCPNCYNGTIKVTLSYGEGFELEVGQCNGCGKKLTGYKLKVFLSLILIFEHE